MKPTMTVLLFCALIMPALYAVETDIAPDGMLLINGERTFILGLYENPKEDAELARAVEAGFNLVQASATVEALDRLQKHDVYAWVNTGSRIDLSENRDKREEDLKAMADLLKDHPSLLVWEVPDEALWNCWYRTQQWRWHTEPEELRQKVKDVEDDDERTRLFAEVARACEIRDFADYEASEVLMDSIWEQLGLEQPHPEMSQARAQEKSEVLCRGMVDGYYFLKKLTPDKPVWMNHAPRNQIDQLAAFNKGADIVGCDIYPVPRHPSLSHSDLDNALMTSVADYTHRMQASAPWKPVWMVLQGFSWADINPRMSEEEKEAFRRPSKSESRFMAYDAIVNGASGVLYWGTAYVEKDSEFLEELYEVITELDALQHVLSAPRAPLDVTVSYQPTFGSVDRKPVVLPKAVGKHPWLITVNEWSEGLATTFSGLESQEGITYRDHHTGEEAVVKDGQLSFNFKRYSVRVLEPVDN